MHARVCAARVHMPTERMLWVPHAQIEVDVAPTFLYPDGLPIRFQREGGDWERVTLVSKLEGPSPHPNRYKATDEKGAPFVVNLTPANHAQILDCALDLRTEHAKYARWVRSSYAFVVDALSGARGCVGVHFLERA